MDFLLNIYATRLDIKYVYTHKRSTSKHVDEQKFTTFTANHRLKILLFFNEFDFFFAFSCFDAIKRNKNPAHEKKKKCF